MIVALAAAALGPDTAGRIAQADGCSVQAPTLTVDAASMRGLFRVIVFPIGVMLLAFGGAASAHDDDLPKVAGETASQVTTASASLAGSVNPNGEPTTYFFEYGPTRVRDAHVPGLGRQVQVPAAGRSDAGRPRCLHHLPLPAGGDQQEGHHPRIGAHLHHARLVVA